METFFVSLAIFGIFVVSMRHLFLSDVVRNARADAVETAISTSPIMRIYAGSVPAHEGASLGAATLLAEITLPSNWLADASAGVKAKAGTWQDASADGTGTATFFRVYASDGTTPHMQGTCSMSGGGGEMILNNTSLAAGQPFTVDTFQWTEPH